MGLADLFGSLAHAAVDSMQGQQAQQSASRKLKRNGKKKGGCTPCQAQKQVDAARKRVEKGYL